jgi:hypothetical protein
VTGLDFMKGAQLEGNSSSELPYQYGELSEAETRMCVKVFNKYDLDGSGKLDKEEMMLALQVRGVARSWPCPLRSRVTWRPGLERSVRKR